RAALGIGTTPVAATGAVARLISESRALLGSEFEDVVARRTRKTRGADRYQRQRRVHAQSPRSVARVGHEVALAAEHRLVLAILQCKSRAPPVTGTAAGELQVHAVAAAVLGSTDGAAQQVAVEVFAQDDVHHASH